ncbi:MAG: heme anaerobic degradation radical SAM methyltransferase ChuW/HutW [Deltaproteobacteria bacterium]|jgi:oxygen-independent coproporphyrinogen-3 oxidase|nr:heme anaerobic degradation radical SAM methyltransferase ChuW/HutW [Deltaproteobacteria bacterium]
MTENQINTVEPPGFGPHDLGPQAFLAQFMARPSPDPLSGAFESKFVVHPGMASIPLPPNQAGEAFAQIMSRPLKGPLSVYLHLPFCESRCLYCGFAGQKAEPDLKAAYVKALLSEIAYLADRPSTKGPVQSIYFGGGTPSSLLPEELECLLEAVKKNYNLCNDCEITLEGRIHDFTPEKAAGFIQAGFNRFSIGIQTFDTVLRRQVGRISDHDKVVELLTNLVSLQKATTVIDLIFGLPGQKLENLIRDIELAEEIEIDALDLYQLNVFNKSPLEVAINSGRIPPAIPLSGQGEFYRQGCQKLVELHWRQLSLSHFARTFRERCLYNLINKRKSDCLGMGAGAGSLMDGWSMYRLPKVDAYLEAVGKGDFSPSFISRPSKGHHLIGQIIEQMEQGYLEFERLVRKFSFDPRPAKTLMENWSQNGLIEWDDRRLKLTLSGRFWGVNLTEALTKAVTHDYRETSSLGALA